MKLAIITNPASPTTDYYRSVGVFKALAIEKKNFEIVTMEMDKIRWVDLYMCDVVFLQRPNGDTMLGIAKELKAMGRKKKIIIDHDDLLHEVERSNPSYKHFANPAVRRTIETIFKLADHVIYSTPYLADYYRPFHEGVKYTVIPNAVDLDVTPLLKPELILDPVRIMWRGSSHHREDLKQAMPIWESITANPKYKLAFLGLQDSEVYSYYPPGIETMEWQTSFFQYLDTLRVARPDVGVFPLMDTPFNRAKSNIFALEMLTFGCVPIVPAGFDEFGHHGVAVYDTIQDALGVIEWVIERQDKIVQLGQNWIATNRNLKKVNELRWGVLNSL